MNDKNFMNSQQTMSKSDNKNYSIKQLVILI